MAQERELREVEARLQDKVQELSSALRHIGTLEAELAQREAAVSAAADTVSAAADASREQSHREAALDRREDAAAVREAALQRREEAVAVREAHLEAWAHRVAEHADELEAQAASLGEPAAVPVLLDAVRRTHTPTRGVVQHGDLSTPLPAVLRAPAAAARPSAVHGDGDASSIGSMPLSGPRVTVDMVGNAASNIFRGLAVARQHSAHLLQRLRWAADGSAAVRTALSQRITDLEDEFRRAGARLDASRASLFALHGALERVQDELVSDGGSDGVDDDGDPPAVSHIRQKLEVLVADLLQQQRSHKAWDDRLQQVYSSAGTAVASPPRMPRDGDRDAQSPFRRGAAMENATAAAGGGGADAGDGADATDSRGGGVARDVFRTPAMLRQSTAPDAGTWSSTIGALGIVDSPARPKV